MEGPVPGRRIIDGKEIIYGMRSECDMKGWTCKCGTENPATRMLVFDVAPFFCCECHEPNPNAYDFCLAFVKVNGVPPISEVKSQLDGEAECVAYTICQMIQLMNHIKEALESDNPDKIKANSTIAPSELIVVHDDAFPPGYVKRDVGFHKMVHMCQRFVRDNGLPMSYQTPEGKWVTHHFKGAKVVMIHCDDYEEVCRQIADGNPVLAPLYVGDNYPNLQYCQYYTAVQGVTVDQFRARKVPFAGHCLLLIGAVGDYHHKYYWALESAGQLFCRQVGDAQWSEFSALFGESILSGGICKISAGSNFMLNFLTVPRVGDDVPLKKYAYNYAPYADDGSSLDRTFEREYEGDRELSQHNRYLMKHGNYFYNRSLEYATEKDLLEQEQMEFLRRKTEMLNQLAQEYRKVRS